MNCNESWVGHEDELGWEESYGTDNIVWFEKYRLHLPYWVAYMPSPDK